VTGVQTCALPISAKNLAVGIVTADSSPPEGGSE
jgi:hypothetical protein